jgi:hypothetical protein
MDAGFILKVLILSAIISVSIKYGGPSLAIAPSVTNALILVFSPTLIVAMLLGTRLWRSRLSEDVK